MKIVEDWEEIVLGMLRNRIVLNTVWLTICLDLMEDMQPQILQSINNWLTSTRSDRVRPINRILHLIARVPSKESKKFCKANRTEQTLERALMYLYGTLMQVSLTDQHTVIFNCSVLGFLSFYDPHPIFGDLPPVRPPFSTMTWSVGNYYI